MHERSLVRSLLNQVERLRLEHHALSVDVVTVELGPLSGVEPELIRSAFEQLAPLQFTSTPRLDVQLIDLTIRCRKCKVEAAVPQITFQCPACFSSRVQVIRGDQFRLIDVSLQISDSSCEPVL